MMRKFIVASFIAAATAIGALGQSQSAPTLTIVAEDGNRLPAELMYGNTKVKPVRLRPGTNTPITINDTDFFVQQQYIDFLGRFPDQGGFAFWQSNITDCGSNAQCIEVRRVNVSAAFFLSIEFQESGYLVYRIYKAAFGDLPGKPVPVVRESFMPEARSISADVIVGTTGWQQRLENNKVAFLQSFVQRGSFLAAYPTSMNATQFVDTLFSRAGVTPTTAERNAALAAFGAGDTAGRAAALRAVAESQTLRDAEFRKAFVLLQYFGYLKRNPDSAPDTNFAGYNFWLDKLNQFNGNFIQAEMVKAFIQSIEYGSRF